MENFGDKLYGAIQNGRGLLFTQGEMSNLTYIAYERMIKFINDEKDEEIKISHPVGFTAEHKPINSETTYTKDELISRFQILGLDRLPLDGIYKLVTISENLLNYILKNILIEFPGKIPNKRKLDVEIALSANSLEEIKVCIIDSILNEIAYKSPREYAEEFQKYTGVNLLEFPTFHKYIELKATRDIHIHNGGIANDIYTTKAATAARVKSGRFLPVNIQYFLESYEACLQLTEILESELNKIWPSNDYREYQKLRAQQTESEEKGETLDKIIEESKKNTDY